MKWLNSNHLFKDIFNKKNEFDKLLEGAAKDNAKKFLIVWNRGLGDIPLGLYALIVRVKAFIPDAEITFITRKELGPAFDLLEYARAITVPWWERGEQISIGKTITELNLSGTYDILIENVNPTKWLSWQIGKIMPRLRWDNKHDNLWRRFGLDPGLFYIGAHINTETSQFYGYRKDWPAENWKTLFDRLLERPDIRLILFGLKKTGGFNHPSILDLREDTGLLEMLSIIKNHCRILIAPDGGILTLAYYLDVQFPITIVSLWSDPNQGVLKQAVASPNKLLKHLPLIGRDNDISTIRAEDVLNTIASPLTLNN